LAATPAAAVIQYGTVSRFVATSAGPNGGFGDSDVDSTGATGIWTASVASAYSDGPPGGGNASASATQVSDLGDLEISMAGDLMGAGAANDPPFGGYGGIAQSSLTASFTLDADSPYMSVLVSTPDVANFDFRSQSANYGANSSGVLPAGSYTLSILFQVTNGGFPGGVSGAYAYNLTIVPEPSSVCLLLMGTLLAAASRRRNCRR
jgi:hypothetical protein